MNTTATITRLDVGTIAVSTWGYDQTNVDFYTVLERKVRKDGSTWVKAVEIGSTQTPSEQFMQYTSVPAPSWLVGKPAWRKVHVSSMNGEESFSPESYSYARPWKGQPVWGSSYA